MFCQSLEDWYRRVTSRPTVDGSLLRAALKRWRASDKQRKSHHHEVASRIASALIGQVSTVRKKQSRDVMRESSTYKMDAKQRPADEPKLKSENYLAAEQRLFLHLHPLLVTVYQELIFYCLEATACPNYAPNWCWIFSRRNHSWGQGWCHNWIAFLILA